MLIFNISNILKRQVKQGSNPYLMTDKERNESFATTTTGAKVLMKFSDHTKLGSSGISYHSEQDLVCAVGTENCSCKIRRD
jgi:hypothetical protein